jgi:hypothetical protein
VSIPRNAPCPCGSGRKFKYCCMRNHARQPASEYQVQSVEELDIAKEANYIVECAKRGDGRVVALGPLIFFSTRMGDAWMLDSQDQLALCLMENGQKQPFRITETDESFGIEWTASYRIDKGAFIVTQRPGKVSFKLDYPTKEILQITRQIRG